MKDPELQKLATTLWRQITADMQQDFDKRMKELIAAFEQLNADNDARNQLGKKRT